MIADLDYPGIQIHVDTTAEEQLRRRSAAKEPETVAWCESLRPGTVLYDVGANCGAYSLIAAKLGHPVIAIEPATPTFAHLFANILENPFAIPLITPLQVAVGARTGLERLDYSSLEAGAASHNLLGPRETFQPVFRQHVLCLTITELVERFGLPLPSALKVDVDGGELEVLEGAPLSVIETVLVEVTDQTSGSVWKYLEDQGLMLVEEHRHESGVTNLVFRR